MLKPELAREQLGTLKSKRNYEGRLAKLKKLPKSAATAGLGLLGLGPDGKQVKDWKERNKLVSRSLVHLDEKPADRAKVIAAWFPTLTKEIAAGWDLFARLPYTVGYDRRAFRAPGRPEVNRSVRGRWLRDLMGSLGQLPDDTLTPEWIAAWAVHLEDSDDLGYFLAALVDRGGATGEQVFEILKDSAANRHDVGGPGRHTTRGLLCCAKPEAWEFMEKLLLAAQRQEGLRQSILEAVDEAHPQAYRRMLALLLKENLVRFASVARAAAVWLGTEESVLEPKQLKKDMQQVHGLLTNPAAVAKAIAKGDASLCYAGLWVLAYDDAEQAVARAIPLLTDKDATRRFAAAKILAETGLPEAIPHFLKLLDDADLRVVSAALTYFDNLPIYGDSDDHDDEADRRPADLFERLEKVIPRLPEKPTKLKPPATGWELCDQSRADAADLLLKCLGKRPAERLIPHLSAMSSWDRVQAIGKLCEPRTIANDVRALLLSLAGQTQTDVRDAALEGLKKCKLAEDEAQTLERYLTRTTVDFRRGVFNLLLSRPDKAVLGSVERLLAAKDGQQRLGGIEIARELTKRGQDDAVRTRLTAFRDGGRKLAKAEAEAVELVLNPPAPQASLDDALGLMNPAELVEVVPPKKRKVKFETPAAVAFLRELDAFIHENRDRTFVAKRYNDTTEEKVLGSVSYRWDFPNPIADKTLEENRALLPLRELWEGWWTSRSAKTHDADGLELLRAACLERQEIREGEDGDDDSDDDDDFDDDDDDDNGAAKKDDRLARQKQAQEAAKELKPLSPVKLRYDDLIGTLLDWFMLLYPPEGAADFALDAAETSFALVPPLLLAHRINPENWGDNDWRDGGPFCLWLQQARACRARPDWTPAHDTRLFRLLAWRDRPGTEVERFRGELTELVVAYEAGSATVADFIDHLLGPRGGEGSRWNPYASLAWVTAAELPDFVSAHPELAAAAERARDRVLAVELARGESPSPATPAAKAIASLRGQATLFRLLKALGKHGFAKQSYSTGDSKPAVLTHLLRNCCPGPDDTADGFTRTAAAHIEAGDFPAERSAELGLLNPRWVTFAEQACGWAGYGEAVYWFMAHTCNSWQSDSERDTDDDEDENGKKKEQKPRDPWVEAIKQRSNLSPEQREDGVIDVTWFHQAYAAVNDDAHWDAIEDAAKFLGYGAGHKKAGRLADVLLGRTAKKDLVEGIRKKNLKEYVRLLGLLPLPDGAAKLEAELVDRFGVLKEYERYARGLSALSKEPAMQAARLGMENLAATAGYADPVRLEWAVGAKLVADLLAGPINASVGAAKATLSLSDFGEPELSYENNGKPAKSLPPPAKKSPKIAELIERKADLKRAASNARRSLEQAMCRGDAFTGAELANLASHALVKPLIERLIVRTPTATGYPVKGGKALRGYDGKAVPVKAGESWSIAHPLDLLASGDWSQWQAECFRNERLQPFKQVFREVYAVTAQEREDGDRSRRYAGQQLNPKQALALFGTRGWSTKEGVDKLFRDAGLVAQVSFDHGITTPAEVEGLTVAALTFRRRGDWKLLPLKDVPGTIFSEVMRDLDLVVSVAHVGGVDPEASASTTEMRAALVRETCQLLKLDNVTTESRHVLVKGEYGRYSIHLGSGVVHKQPGGSLCIVPVHAQHRGRLFLPFADDDPRTAEVVSKVLLLARDHEIQDPTILEQIAHR